MFDLDARTIASLRIPSEFGGIIHINELHRQEMNYMCRGKCHAGTGLKNCINIWLINTSYQIFYVYTQLSYNAYGLRPTRKMRTRLPTMPSERDIILSIERAKHTTIFRGVVAVRNFDGDGVTIIQRSKRLTSI